ncbi:hypothetical protein ABT009_40780 [Streptomyces sp. NPDC002896]|uniref:hypothetical protein n=1 Tax=Streptomyces sp. NPDC002896 TaxID=3154438 RepID=UPI00332E7933
MTHSSRPSTKATLDALPGLAPFAREAVVLRPERGEPTARDSSIGGPLLWPDDEPWPTCSLPDETDPTGLPATAMVPVAQIFERDMPGPWWPAGTDLLQILWCPNEHWDPPAQQADVSPVVEVRWRRAADIGRTVAASPSPSRRSEDGHLPQPCTIIGEPLADFPFREELPPEFRPALEELVRRTGDGGDVITRVGGWKLGGWPTWHLTHPMVFRCDRCATEMRLLFTVSSDDVTEVVVGRWGDLRIFTCPADHRHPFQVDLH